MRLRHKRQSSPNGQKELEETPSSSTANTSTSNNDSSPELVTPPSKRRMNLDTPAVPVAKKKRQPQPVNEGPLNVLMQDLDKISKTVNRIKEGVTPIIKRIEKDHGTRIFMVTNEFADKVKEVSEKTSALYALVPDCVNIKPIRKQIQMIRNNCRELFKEDDFRVISAPIELIGFKWFLVATTKKKGYLGLYLVAEPPKDYTGNYRIKVNYRFSILNADTGEDLIKGHNGQVYTMDVEHPSGYGLGFQKMAKLENLLDSTQAFLTPEGEIQFWVDFTIKSSTLDHLDLSGRETHREIASLINTQ